MPITLACVFGRSKILQVRVHVQTANSSALQGHDMVNLHPGRAVLVNLTDLIKVGPNRRPLLYMPLSACVIETHNLRMLVPVFFVGTRDSFFPFGCPFLPLDGSFFVAGDTPGRLNRPLGFVACWARDPGKVPSESRFLSFGSRYACSNVLVVLFHLNLV